MKVFKINLALWDQWVSLINQVNLCAHLATIVSGWWSICWLKESLLKYWNMMNSCCSDRINKLILKLEKSIFSNKKPFSILYILWLCCTINHYNRKIRITKKIHYGLYLNHNFLILVKAILLIPNISIEYHCNCYFCKYETFQSEEGQNRVSYNYPFDLRYYRH